MPPALPETIDHNPEHDFALLSDADVGLLHEIILAAERTDDVNDHPFRALFAAYSQVLADCGIDPDHDQIYLRFLFRLGERRQAGDSLYESFVSFLDGIGIQIQLEEDDESRSEAGAASGEIDMSMLPEASALPLGRSRRASFSSYQNTKSELTKQILRRNASATSLPKVQATVEAGSPVRPRNASSLRSGRRNPLPAKPTDNYQKWLSSYEDPNVKRQLDQTHKLRGQYTNHTRGSGNQKRRLQSRHWATHSPATSAHGTLSSWESQRMDAELVPDPTHYTPSLTQLIRDADTFDYFRARSYLKNIISKWRQSTHELQERSQRYQRQAIEHDQNILLQQAYEQWRSEFLSQQQIAATERFFQHLEKRAEKARDIHLLTKALTHWSQYTRDEAEEGQAAYEHFLQAKFLRTWRDSTASNQVKVRDLELQKGLRLWRKRYHLQHEAHGKAVYLYQHSLVESIYWRWFWTFCEQRAPEWRDLRLKRKILSRWIGVVSTELQQTIKVTTFRREKTGKQLFARWISRTRTIRAQHQHAEEEWQKKRIVEKVAIWSKEAKYAPIARHVSSMVDWRVVSSAFSILLMRWTLIQQAIRVDHQRIVRNSWTQWNDLLRREALVRQIDDRIATQALYKWVLAERFVLLQRLCDERLQKASLGQLVEYQRHLTNTYQPISIQLAQSHDRRYVGNFLSTWHQRAELRLRQSRQASQFYDQHSFQLISSRLRARKEHLDEMTCWGKRAAIFFDGRRTLRQWRTAVEAHQKKRRQDSYATIRHRVNSNLCKRLVRKWSEYTTNITLRVCEVQQQCQQRDVAIASILLDHWSSRSAHLRDWFLETYLQRERNCTITCLRYWTSKLDAAQQDDLKALEFADIRVEMAAYDSLRLLRLKSLDFQSKASKAQTWREWHERRQSHNMLRIWYECLLRKQGFEEPEISRTTRSRRFGMRSSILGPTETTEVIEEEGFKRQAWNPMLEAQAGSPPIPTFLATPSKKAIRALLQESTTPAGIPRFETPSRARRPLGSNRRRAFRDAMVERSDDIPP